MPAFVLGTGVAAVVMRQMRSSMLESRAPTTSARRGPGACPSPRSSGSMPLRNSLIAIVTLVGLQMGALISGAVVTEQIFVIQVRQAHHRRDLQAGLPVIQGVVLVAAAGYMIINLTVDLSTLVDPSADPDRGEGQ